ncbi:hypothetical protein N7519_009247 [Penicillium mononematosum]|uniref:uncharacterized protein n=1 Tax=Penicillium mononematosum TaxID=268346 RepID=UPI002547828A|nr:uncharacterized protein N7519_009247 [Penicillium mononematosum]KAJ6178786.1 hypothetical protein N7519_009247 [Penicillium mononematosum]
MGVGSLHPWINKYNSWMFYSTHEHIMALPRIDHSSSHPGVYLICFTQTNDQQLQMPDDHLLSTTNQDYEIFNGLYAGSIQKFDLVLAQVQVQSPLSPSKQLVKSEALLSLCRPNPIPASRSDQEEFFCEDCQGYEFEQSGDPADVHGDKPIPEWVEERRKTQPLIYFGSLLRLPSGPNMPVLGTYSSDVYEPSNSQGNSSVREDEEMACAAVAIRDLVTGLESLIQQMESTVVSAWCQWTGHGAPRRSSTY